MWVFFIFLLWFRCWKLIDSQKRAHVNTLAAVLFPGSFTRGFLFFSFNPHLLGFYRTLCVRVNKAEKLHE